MKYKKYLSYKDSGVEWLDKIPTEWVVSRNKIAFQFVKSLVGKESNNYQLLSLTLNGIIPRDIESGKGKFPAEFDTYQKVENNDLIFCLFDIDETPRTIGISNYDGMITGAYNVVRCTLLANPKFIYYYYLSIDEYKGLKPFYTGLRKVVRAETFMNIQLALPSVEEQQQIAIFLDKATTKIDTLIEKQKKQIELLKEKRLAVISHAVTKGINPNVPMKDSGVEWLGVIPEHWEVASLKYISTITLGKMLTNENNGHSFKKSYLKAKNLKWFNVDVSDVSDMWFTKNELKTLRLHKNDLLVSEGGEVGRTCLWLEELDECYIQNSVNRVSFFNHNPKYFLYQFFTAGQYGYFDSIVNRISIAHLTKEKLGDAKFTCIPLNEQLQIVNYLDEKTSKIDTLIEKSKKSIELLKEKRTALISACVTGKIDVRELV